MANKPQTLPSVLKIYKEQAALDKKLTSIQTKCKHPNVDKEYKSNTGNYDPSADSYWVEYTCPRCDKYWIEDQ